MASKGYISVELVDGFYPKDTIQALLVAPKILPSGFFTDDASVREEWILEGVEDPIDQVSSEDIRIFIQRYTRFAEALGLDLKVDPEIEKIIAEIRTSEEAEIEIPEEFRSILESQLGGL